MSYNQKDIEQFLEALKKLPENVNKKMVHQLLNEPTTVARLSETKHFKPFKIISMITIISTALMIWMTWSSSSRTPEKDSRNDLNRTDTVLFLNSKNKPHISDDSPKHANQNNKQDAKKVENQSIHDANPIMDQDPAPNAFKNTPQTKLLTVQNETKYDCVWPTDTVLNGWDLILDLSMEELSNLGFEYVYKENEQTGLFYHNNHQGDTTAMYMVWWSEDDSWYGEASGPNSTFGGRNQKNKPSHHDFFPIYQTDFTMEPFLCGGLDFTGDLELANDHFLAVRLKKDQFPVLLDGTRLLWFKVSDSFYDALPERHQYLKQVMSCVRKMKSERPEDDIIQYERKQIVSTTEALELPQHVLEQLGVIFQENRMTFSFNDDGCRVTLTNDKHGGAGVMLDSDENIVKSTFPVNYMTDSKGRQYLSWSCGGKKKKNIETFLNDHQYLIPVVLRKENYPNFLLEDQYWWFEPTPEFLAIIPGHLGEQIREEYNYLISEDKTGLTTSCTFFEACRATLHIHDLKLFPNPTNGPFAVSFTIPREELVDISIADMNGMEILRLEENYLLQTGINQINGNISTLPEGIYLLVIHGKGGFVTQRLILQK